MLEEDLFKDTGVVPIYTVSALLAIVKSIEITTFLSPV
jgi:hypothetical protein